MSMCITAHIIRSVILLILASLIIFLPPVSAEDYSPYQEPAKLVLQALEKSDQITSQDDPEETCQQVAAVQDELLQAREQFTELSVDERAALVSDTMIRYIDFWLEFETGFCNMTRGAEFKRLGYGALKEKTPGSYSLAYEFFSDATDQYTYSQQSFEESRSVLQEWNTSVIAAVAPNATLPNEGVLDEILYRISDNVVLCRAYAHLCNAEIIRGESEDLTSTDAEIELKTGRDLMQTLISSPYVGKEAALFSNVTLV